MNDLVARIRADQREQWLRGNRVWIEHYLARHPELAGQEEVVLDLIYGEVVLREELGDTVVAAEYLKRFPQYADRLRRQFDLHELLRDSVPVEDRDTLPEAGPARPRESAPSFPAIPGYEILEQFPAGGPGVVYKAHQAGLNRVVALKMIRHEEDAADPRRRALFRREAEAVARLNHPNIVQIYDFGEHQGRFYFTMEYVEGGGLDRALAAGPLTPRRAAELAEALARALHAVHREGIVHRDLKPANVLLTADGTPKVADFGLAKWLNTEASLTPSGAVVGTASYMAPEQAAGHGREVTATADVYSLGALLYQMLTGRPPFRGPTFVTTLGQVLAREPDAPRLGRQDRDLEAICLKCLEKEPGRRYASAGELADDLRRFLDGTPSLARPRRWYQRAWRAARRRPALWAAAVVVMLLAPAAISFALRPAPPDPDLEQKQTEAWLAGGKPYRFAGHEPLPGPFRLLDDSPGSLAPVADAGCFVLDSLDPSLLELVTDPGSDHYLFSAEVRHTEQVEGSSQVGLFFGLRRSPDGSQYGYYTLSFADIGYLAMRTREHGQPVSALKVSAYARRKGGASQQFPVEKVTLFRPLWARKLDDWQKFDNRIPLVAGVGGGAAANLNVWRRVGVQVTPTGVTAFWLDEQGGWRPQGPIPATLLEKRLRQLTVTHTQTAGVPTRFSPRAGLGLYVYRGGAWFRRVEIIPLPKN